MAARRDLDPNTKPGAFRTTHPARLVLAGQRPGSSPGACRGSRSSLSSLSLSTAPSARTLPHGSRGWRGRFFAFKPFAARARAGSLAQLALPPLIPPPAPPSISRPPPSPPRSPRGAEGGGGIFGVRVDSRREDPGWVWQLRALRLPSRIWNYVALSSRFVTKSHIPLVVGSPNTHSRP